MSAPTPAQRRLLAWLGENGPATANVAARGLYGKGGVLNAGKVDGLAAALEAAGLVEIIQPPQSDHDRELNLLPQPILTISPKASTAS